MKELLWFKLILMTNEYVIMFSPHLMSLHNLFRHENDKPQYIAKV